MAYERLIDMAEATNDPGSAVLSDEASARARWEERAAGGYQHVVIPLMSSNMMVDGRVVTVNEALCNPELRHLLVQEGSQR